MTPDEIKRFLDKNLDVGYDRAVRPFMRAAASTLTDGVLAERLNQLEAEAKRLELAGQRLEANNPVLRALYADLEVSLKRQAALINEASGALTESAVTAASQSVRDFAYIRFENPNAVAEIGWNRPDPEMIARVVDYTQSDAWQALLNEYAVTNLEDVQASVIAQILQGKGARAIARDLRSSVDGLLIRDANTLARTLQLTAWRDAEVVNRMANADILSYQVRICSLDGRACLACIARHGQRLPIDQRIDDHPNGRCTSVAMVRGFEYPIQTGAEWFAQQPIERQRELAGQSAYRALKAGDVSLTDFVGQRQDAVFGTQIYQLSLKGVLGDAAKRYYKQ